MRYPKGKNATFSNALCIKKLISASEIKKEETYKWSGMDEQTNEKMEKLYVCTILLYATIKNRMCLPVHQLNQKYEHLMYRSYLLA